MFTFISLERTTRRMVVIAVVIFTILSFYGLYTAYAAGPALEITKDFGGATSLEVESGREFTYYIAYRCASITEDCNNVSVVDELPPELEYVEARGPIADVENISYNAGTHEVTFDFVDPLGAGTTGVLELSVRFPYGTLPGTTAVNDAVSWSNAIQFTSNETTATATGSFEMIANKIVTNDFDDAVIGAPFVTNYKLQACSPDPYGGVHLTNPTITDQLPVSATYLSSSHGGVYDPGTHSVTWTYISNGGGLPDVIPVVNGCGLTVDLDLLYHPDGPDGIPGNADDPIAGVTVTNNMTLEGDPEDGSAPVNLGDGVGVQLRDPYFEDGAGKSAASPSSYTGHGIEELPGGVVTYDLSYGNTGTITATNVILTDTIPSSLIVTSIDVQSAVDPIAGFYEVNSNPGVWLPFPDNNYIVNTSVPVTTTVTAVSGDIELNSGEYLTGVSFHLGDLPPDTSWTSTVNTIVNPALGPGVTIPNCIDTIATWNDNGTPAQASQHECTTVTTIDPRAIPRVGKSTSDDSLQPGDVAQFTLTAGNDAVAHNNVLTPITLVDLLPPEFELVIPDATQQSGYRLPTAPELTAGSWYSFTTTDSAPPPTHTYTPNFNGDDETLMRWEWTGAYEQEPGNVLTIRFYARIKDYMVPQTVGNQAIILTGPATVNPLGCTGGNLYTDAPDVDEDLDFTEEGCQF
ncbi:MAG: DUF11 domain-containing protein, partial [Anaerolineales bacterium]|nr:DUF11 domain-containing protein [Anaerolineales bacterium]